MTPVVSDSKAQVQQLGDEASEIPMRDTHTHISLSLSIYIHILYSLYTDLSLSLSLYVKATFFFQAEPEVTFLAGKDSSLKWLSWYSYSEANA